MGASQPAEKQAKEESEMVWFGNNRNVVNSLKRH